MTISQLFEKMRNGTAETADVTSLLNELKSRGVKDADGVISRIKSKDNTETDTVEATNAYNSIKSREDADQTDTDEQGDTPETPEETNIPEDKSRSGDSDEVNDETDGDEGADGGDTPEETGDDKEDLPSDKGRDLRKSRKQQVITNKSRSLSGDSINELFMQGMDNVVKGRSFSGEKGSMVKMFKLRTEAELNGETLSLQKAVNTLATPGGSNISLASSVVAAVMDFAFSDQKKIYSLGGYVATTPINSNSFSGDLLSEAVVSDRTQGTDSAGNSQGTKTHFTTTLTERTVGIDLDYSALSVSGNPVAVLRQSVARAVMNHKEKQIVNAITSASGTVTAPLGTGKGLQDLTTQLWQEFVGNTPGLDSEKVVAMSGAAAGVMRGITVSGVPQFVDYPYNQNRDLLGGIRFIQSDVMPNASATDGVKDVDTAVNAAFIGDIQRACRYVVNQTTQRAGADYDSRKHSIFVYNHWADSAILMEPALVSIIKTHTA